MYNVLAFRNKPRQPLHRKDKVMRKHLCNCAVIGLIIGLCALNARAESYVGKLRTIEFAHDDLLKLTEQPEENPDPDAISRYLFRNSVNWLLQESKIKELAPGITTATNGI